MGGGAYLFISNAYGQNKTSFVRGLGRQYLPRPFVSAQREEKGQGQCLTFCLSGIVRAPQEEAAAPKGAPLPFSGELRGVVISLWFYSIFFIASTV